LLGYKDTDLTSLNVFCTRSTRRHIVRSLRSYRVSVMLNSVLNAHFTVVRIRKIFIRTGLCLPAADVQSLQCYICGSHIDVTCAGRFEQGGYKGEQTTIDPTTFLPCQICTKNEYTHNGNTRTYDGTLLTLIDNTQVTMLHITSCSSTQT